MPAFRPASASPVLTLLTMLVATLLSIGGIHATAQSSPETFETLAARAAAARDKNDAALAIQLYTRAEQLDPRWASGWWSLGLLQYSAGKWPEAQSAFSRYIDLSPAGAPATTQAIALRGMCETRTGDYSNALGDLQHAAAIAAANDPASAGILRLHQAELLTRMGRFEEAIGIYRTLAADGQATPDMNIAVGLAGLRIAQLPSDVSPDQKLLLNETGAAGVRFMVGDQAGAAQDFAQIFERFPSTPNAHYFYGFLLLPTSPALTIAEYRQELKVDPGNVQAAAMLAWVLLAQEDPVAALPFAQTAVNEAPDLPVAQLVLGQSLAGTGRLDDAIQHLEASLRLEPRLLETHVALATAYARAGRHEDARQERLQSLALAEASVARH